MAKCSIVWVSYLKTWLEVLKRLHASATYGRCFALMKLKMWILMRQRVKVVKAARGFGKKSMMLFISFLFIHFSVPAHGLRITRNSWLNCCENFEKVFVFGLVKQVCFHRQGH